MDAVLSKPVELEALRVALAAAVAAGAPNGALGPEELLDRSIVASLRSQRIAPGLPLLDKLVDLYVADAPGQIEGLREAATRGAAVELAATAHRLTGSSGVIGARTIGALASKIELLARASDMRTAVPIVADLEQAWPATRDALLEAAQRGAGAD